MNSNVDSENMRTPRTNWYNQGALSNHRRGTRGDQISAGIHRFLQTDDIRFTPNTQGRAAWETGSEGESR